MNKILLIAVLIGLTSQQATDIVFDLVDLSTNYYDPILGTIFLEAYKSSKNDLIMSRKEVENYGQLKWISIGYPNLVKTLNPTTRKYELFILTAEGFEVAIEMLTDKHRKLFVDLVKDQYKIDINMNQILTLIPAKFECQIYLYDENNNKMLINGKVNQLTRLPFKLKFQAPLKTKERIYFEQKFNKEKDKLDLEIQCKIYSQGQEYKENTLIIKGDQMYKIGLIEEIFGDGDEKYVSRNQMSSLSSELYLKLSIIEDYKLSETEFKQSFIEDFIRQTYLEISDKYMPIDEVLSKLSSYDLSEDLKPTVLKDEYSRLFFINKTGSKEFLQINNTQYEKLNTQSSSNSDKSAGGSYKLFNFKASASYSSNQKSEWEKLNISFSEQLRELNQYSENEIEWARSGNIVIPKSLKVSRLGKANFNKNLIFVRIKKTYFEALYEESVFLETKTALQVPQAVLDNTQRLQLLEKETTYIKNQLRTMNSSLVNTTNQLNSFQINFANITDLKIMNQSQTFTRLLEAKGQYLVDLHNSVVNRIDNLPNFIMQKGSWSTTNLNVVGNLLPTRKYAATFTVPFKSPPNVFYSIKVNVVGDNIALLYTIRNEVITRTGLSMEVVYHGACYVHTVVFEWVAFGY
jgi:hypothetical protein